MNEKRRNSSSSSDDLSTHSKYTLPKQAKRHYLNVRCLSKKKTLKSIRYTSLDDLKNDAYQLYKDAGFNDSNAILTYLNNSNVEVLLTSVPDLPTKGDSKDLFIRFVRPVCAMCSNPFGIVDNQLLYQCSRIECSEQYCHDCVQSVRGTYLEYQFTCVACKKNVIPQRNVLIEKHIIWKNMCKLYGIQSLLDLKMNSELISCDSILKNIKFRYIHLKSQLNILRSRIELPTNQMKRQDTSSLFDEMLINDVKDLCNYLQELTERIEMIDQQMNRCGIIVSECLKTYQHGMKHFDRLCHVLIENIGKLQSVDNNNITSDGHEEHIKDLYRMHDLDKLSSDENIKAVDRILEDIDFRRKCLSPRLAIITSLLNDQPDEINSVEKDLERAKKKLEIILNVETQLKDLRANLEQLNQHIAEYDKLLRDEQYPEIPCSKFILLLEKMRVRTEQLEVSEHFPQTLQLMNDWQNDYGTDEEFKPKVIDLCRMIELDVQHLFTNHHWIYSVPYKIGVIGHGSVGKSALVMKLAEIEEFSSMIDVERSTFNYLQFDTFIYKDPRDSSRIIPITFVDVEGATDADESVSIGNYLELINKADCDMYIIVFDDFFHGHNRICQKHIENNLKRKCLFVRSKADLLFQQYFQRSRQEKHEKADNEDYQMKMALCRMRIQALKTFDDKTLDDFVYLTAAVPDDNLKDVPFADFDFDKLKAKLIEFAITDFRGQRISDLATRAAITVINTCFRRGYSISQTKYKWLAAGSSLIPFLDELPKYFGRKRIRQAFGIQDGGAECRTNDSFEEYLKGKKLAVPKDCLTSGEFKYLTTRTANIQLNQTLTSRKTSTMYVPQALNIARHSFVVLGAVGRVADDAARIVAPTATVTLRTVSIAGIVIGAVLTPIFAAWSFYSAGQSMNRELHSICDDLVVILQYFIVDRCNDCFQNIKLPVHPLSDNHISSSDED